MQEYRVRRSLVAALAAVTFMACSTDAPKPGSIDLTLSTASGSVAQGSFVSVPATVIRDGDFDGAVSFAVDGLPIGVTAGANGITRDAATTTALLTFAASATVTPGVYPLVIRGIGNGVDDSSQPYTLTITAVTSANYSIGITPMTLQVIAGLSGTGAITLTRTVSFAGNVALSATSTPPGVSVTFSPTSTAANTSTMTVAVPATLTPGAYTIFVHGTASGLADKSFPFTLVVLDAATVGVLVSAPASVTVPQGASGTVSVIGTRTGDFAGNVTFTATGMPTGMTAIFNPSSTASSATALTITTTSAVPVGSYPLMIHANGTGITESTTTLTVTVSASGN